MGRTVCIYGRSQVCRVDYPHRNNVKSLALCPSALSLPVCFCGCLTPSLSVHRGCSNSETESEAGDLLDQQFEELNNKLNSVTDPTGFLRMVSRNNLFNR